jgi:hypothetical protein
VIAVAAAAELDNALWMGETDALLLYVYVYGVELLVYLIAVEKQSLTIYGGKGAVDIVYLLWRIK